MASAEIRASRRPKRSLIVVVLTGLVALFGSLAVLRLTSLRGLPDIGDPFDIAQQSRVEVTDDEDANTYYRRAVESLGAGEPISMKGAYQTWSEVDEPQLRWLASNGRALEAWMEGTRRERALMVRVGNAMLDDNRRMSQELRRIARLASLKAFELEHRGDLAGSWTWLRANLRMSRHACQNGFLIDRLIGLSIYVASSGQVSRWADNPAVDAPLLHRALDDLLAIDAMTPPNSDFLRNEYIAAMNTLDDPDRRDRTLAMEYLAPEQITARELAKLRSGSTLAAFNHEPERSRRVIRLIVANWLAAIDLPSAERAEHAFKLGGLILFRPAGGESSPLPVEEIARWFETTRFARGYYANLTAVERALSREEAARAALIVHVAEQLYLREHGELPDSAAKLIGPYLKRLPVGYLAPDDESKPPGASR